MPVAEFRNSYNDNLTSTSTGNECGYIGFESNQVGGTFPDEDMWSIPSSCMISTDAHSGYSSLRIPLAPSQNTFSYSAQRFFKPDRQDFTFRFSAWLKTPTQLSNYPSLVIEVRHENGNAIMDGTTNVGYFYTSVTQTNNQWKYIEKTVDLGKFRSDFSSLITPTEKLLLSCYIVNYDLSNSILSDDYRFEALPSSTKTYNYSFADLKLSDITDINSTTSYYNYDDLGRLSVVSDFQKCIVNNYTYGFCRPTYCNPEMSQYFTTQCGNSQTPSVEVYTVNANTYCSDISQAAANALAQAEIDQNGQSHANAVGTCPTCPVSEEFMIINGECLRGFYIWESEEVIHCTGPTCKTKTYYHYEFFTSTGELFQGPQLVATTACMGC